MRTITNANLKEIYQFQNLIEKKKTGNPLKCGQFSCLKLAAVGHVYSSRKTTLRRKEYRSIRKRIVERVNELGHQVNSFDINVSIGPPVDTLNTAISFRCLDQIITMARGTKIMSKRKWSDLVWDYSQD